MIIEIKIKILPNSSSANGVGAGSSSYNCTQSQICSFQALTKILQEDVLNTWVILYLGK